MMTVNAYAQNLSVLLFKPAVVNPERRNLITSSACKIENVE
jgi:hypothetical protein